MIPTHENQHDQLNNEPKDQQPNYLHKNYEKNNNAILSKEPNNFDEQTKDAVANDCNLSCHSY